MSSFNIRALRDITTDPNQQRINELAKKLARFVTQNINANLTDIEDVVSDGQQIDTAVKYHDEIYHVKKYTDWYKSYFPIADIDNDKFSVWLRGNHLGDTLKDMGFNGLNATIYGEPKLINGDFDLGYLGGTYKSLAVRFNRPTSITVNKEWLQVPDSTKLQVNAITIGHGFFLRIRPQSFAQQNGVDQTYFTKVDDNTPNNAQQLEVDTTGRLTWTVRRASVNYRVKVPVGSAMTANTVYDIFGTYNVTGNVQKIYINGTDTVAVTDVGSPVWQADLISSHDLFLLKRGKPLIMDNTEEALDDPPDDRGYSYADFYDFKYWREKVLTPTEISNHQTNKMSISNMGFGNIIIANHFTPVVPVSFTSASFTSASFTNGFTA